MMKGALQEIYGRVLPFVRAMPFVVAIPFAAEMAQHAVEIQAGMYAPSGEVTPDEQKLRLVFGAFKVLSIFLVLLFAVRWWAFGGDARRAARPTALLFKGLGIILLVQIGGELLLMAIGRLLTSALGPAAQGQRAMIALTIGPALVWLFLASLLLPWFVGLLTEDRAMTLRRSARAISGRLWVTFFVLLGAYLPPMIAHYVLGYGSMGLTGPAVWALMLVDSAVVALLAVLLASAYYTIYRRASGPDDAAGATASATA